MRKRSVVLAFVAAMMVAGAPAALAQPPTTTSPAPVAGKPVPAKPGGQAGIQAADGYFYAWVDAGFTGDYCAWQGHVLDYRNPYDTTMPKECWPPSNGMDNITSSVWNNGFGADADSVRMHRDYNAAFGPSMCIDRGDYWADLNLGIERFDTGEFANDKISSHRWVAGCA